jgi:hypothetical protein
MPLTPWSPRLTQAKAKRATAVAAAHEKLPQEGIRLRILAGRACDLAVAVSSAPAPDPAEIEARRGRYEAEMGEARRLFEDGSACLWYALRVGGFRGNFPESFGTSWPTSELHERQIFNTMPPHWACKEIATQQRIEALSRLLTAAQVACAEAVKAPGVRADALVARMAHLRRKADALLKDARERCRRRENRRFDPGAWRSGIGVPANGGG